MSLDPAVLNEAVGAIRRRAAAMRAELALADALEDISKIENAANEAQVRLEKLRADENALREDIRRQQFEAEAGAEDMKRAADVDAAKLRDEAQKVLDTAHGRAAEMLATARTDAAGVKLDADQHVAAARKRLNDLTAQHVDLEAKMESARADHADLQEALAERGAEHERIKQVIAEAKARLG